MRTRAAFLSMPVNAFLILSLLLLLSAGCYRNKCADAATHWINEAPAALEEFMIVKQELLADTLLLEKFTHQGSFFIGFNDTDKLSSYKVPALRSWFARGRGYIHFEKGDTSFCFRECENGRYTAYGHIYYRKKDRDYKYQPAVQVIDSLVMDKWIAHVTTCDGCND